MIIEKGFYSNPNLRILPVEDKENTNTMNL